MGDYNTNVPSSMIDIDLAQSQMENGARLWNGKGKNIKLYNQIQNDIFLMILTLLEIKMNS